MFVLYIGNINQSKKQDIEIFVIFYNTTEFKDLNTFQSKLNLNCMDDLNVFVPDIPTVRTSSGNLSHQLFQLHINQPKGTFNKHDSE